MCEAGRHFKPDIKRGGVYGTFIPDESDGIPASGKRKTRFTRNSCGILEGESATRGETIKFKTNVGSSSGAPAQDHYTYDTGVRVVDNEFLKDPTDYRI